jgi:hypothetical protein
MGNAQFFKELSLSGEKLDLATGARLFKEFDKDKSGFLDKKEVDALIKTYCKANGISFAVESYRESFWRDFDLDGDGKISLDEITGARPSVLMRAVRFCDVNDKGPEYFDAVKKLVEEKANVNKTDDTDGFMPFHQAVVNMHPQMVEYLISVGANPHAKCNSVYSIGYDSDVTGLTGLHICATHAQPNVDVLKFLLDVGVDPTIQDSAGKTFLDLAWSHKNLSLVRAYFAYYEAILDEFVRGSAPVSRSNAPAHVDMVSFLAACKQAEQCLTALSNSTHPAGSTMESEWRRAVSQLNNVLAGGGSAYSSSGERVAAPSTVLTLIAEYLHGGMPGPIISTWDGVQSSLDAALLEAVLNHNTDGMRSWFAKGGVISFGPQHGEVFSQGTHAKWKGYHLVHIVMTKLLAEIETLKLAARAEMLKNRKWAEDNSDVEFCGYKTFWLYSSELREAQETLNRLFELAEKMDKNPRFYSHLDTMLLKADKKRGQVTRQELLQTAQDPLGLTILHYAMWETEGTSLETAQDSGSSGLVKFLMENGGDLSVKAGGSGLTPLTLNAIKRVRDPKTLMVSGPDLASLMKGPPSSPAGQNGSSSSSSRVSSEPGCYLTFSDASNGTLFLNWKENAGPVPDALAFFKPVKPVPKFKYQGGGVVELARSCNSIKMNFYTGFCSFVKLAQEFGALFILKKPEVAIYTIGRSQLTLAVVDQPLDLRTAEAIAVVPPLSTSFEGAKTMDLSAFSNQARLAGGFNLSLLAVK